MESGRTTRTAQTIIRAGGTHCPPRRLYVLRLQLRQFADTLKCGALRHAELPEPPPIVLGLCAYQSALGALGVVRPSKCERGRVRGRSMWGRKTSAALAAIRGG
jgi:hypothetical protein